MTKTKGLVISEVKSQYSWYVPGKREGMLLFPADFVANSDHGFSFFDTGELEFYSFHSLTEHQLLLVLADLIRPYSTYSDIISKAKGTGSTIYRVYVQRLDDPHMIMRGWETLEDAAYQACKRMLCTDTDQTYGWSSCLSIAVERLKQERAKNGYLLPTQIKNKQQRTVYQRRINTIEKYWDQKVKKYVDPTGTLEIPSWNSIVDLAFG
jgi:hypothetical protein